MQQPDTSETERKLKSFVRTFVVVLLAGFVVVFSVKFLHERNLEDETLKAASEAPAVEVIAAAKSPSSLPLTLPGETAAWYESTIYARVDGYVAKWTADIGDHVQKGQVLATIDTPDLDSQLVAVQAKLKASEASVEFTKSTYDRWKNSPNGVVSEQERESKKADYDRALAQLGLDQADVDRYTTLTQFKQVTAPYDGTITERHIDIGNLVTAGSTSNTTLLYRIVQDDPIRVFVDVPQGAADDIKDNTVAHIATNDSSGHVFDGKVARTADAIDPQSRTLKVEVDIPNSDHNLKPGMYVDVAFEVPTTGVVQIPAAALVFRPSGPQVAVVGKDNKVAFHKVTIARDNGNTLEISYGLSEGDRIALNIGNQMTDGETIDVHEVKNDAPAKKP